MMNSGWTESELYVVRERAHSLYLQGKHAEAAVLFEGTVTIDPGDRYSRYALATVYLALGRAQQAIGHLDILIGRDAGDIEARARRCEALLELGDRATAVAEFRALRNILPATQAAQLQLRLEAAGAAPRLP